MIAEPISFTGKLSLQDFLDIHRFHSRVVMRRRFRVLLAVVSGTMIALLFTLGTSRPRSVGWFLTLAFFAYVPFGWLLTDRLAVRWRYRRTAHRLTEHTATFTNESVSVRGPTSDVRLSWSELASIVDTPRGLLILLPPHSVWFWLPQRLFEDDRGSRRQAILDLAAEHGVACRPMN